MNEWQRRILPLAAISQTSFCVWQLANQGSLSDKNLAIPLMRSVLKLDSQSLEDVYGTTETLLPGLQAFINHTTSSQAANSEQAYYIIHLIRLEGLLQKNKSAMKELGRSLLQIQKQQEVFHFDTNKIEANLASVYRDVISPLSKPIQVRGNPRYLSNEYVQHKVRALLLAGIRSAVLWRQMGGKKRHFILNRKRMVTAAQELL